ncbi:hypothetical protein BJY00DRAFT_306749 [Aspergillus carlsbadensis]|nr:hypothetical protein BJY00DRAFT_306749 [Aspergillus carlsbadensis]
MTLYRGSPQANNQSAWIYQGSSWDAFDPQKAYLGPFNGHFNGAVVMKELQNPWLHWQSAAGSVHECLSPAQIEHFKTKPYLSTSNLALGNTKSADHLETIVRRGVTAWNAQRIKHDFKNEDGSLRISPDNIPRWVAHLLLTTTVNIHCGERAQPEDKDIVTVPPSHFFNKDVLAAYQPAAEIYSDFDGISISREHYDSASEQLGLSRLKEVTSFDNVPLRLQVILDQRSWEANSVELWADFDTQGALNFQNIKRTVSLMSAKLFNCLMMMDYWNPIYSWKRGTLMQYMPPSATLVNNTYSLDDDSIAALKQSPHASQESDVENVEKEFLDLYENYNLATMSSRVSRYAERVKERLQTAEGVFDYMLLAESRRRIYRPLPLNEFGLTLPFALSYSTRDSLPLKEMTESGTVVHMPPRGIRFLTLWTATLWSDDPEILPLPRAYMYTHEDRPAGDLDPVSTLALPQRERTRRAG